MIIDQIAEIAVEAGKIILDAEDDKAVEKKTSRHDLVTKYDRLVQDYIVTRLNTLCPSATIVAEESESNPEHCTGRTFIIDPIDGTANFIKGLRHSCVSIALYDGNSPECGVVYCPYDNELFTATAGNGAMLNGERIHVSSTSFENALVAFGTSPYNPSLYSRTLAAASKLVASCMDLRRSGSAALDLCYLACGRFDAFYELQLSPWDFAAGRIIAQEAGALFSNVDGIIPEVYAKSSIIATNPECYNGVFEILSELNND